VWSNFSIYSRWASYSFFGRLICCVLVSLFIINGCITTKTFADGVSTEIVASIQPVRYVYLNNFGDIKKIDSNTNKIKDINLIFVASNGTNVKPTSDQMQKYIKLLSEMNLNETGTIYVSIGVRYQFAQKLIKISANNFSVLNTLKSLTWYR
jgi:hypothetical protein